MLIIEGCIGKTKDAHRQDLVTAVTKHRIKSNVPNIEGTALCMKVSPPWQLSQFLTQMAEGPPAGDFNKSSLFRSF